MSDFVVIANEDQVDSLIRQWLEETIHTHQGEQSHPDDVLSSKKLVKAAKRLFNYISVYEDHYEL
jgi:hypothetical protein